MCILTEIELVTKEEEDDYFSSKKLKIVAIHF
jgi:hypothetical protein